MIVIGILLWFSFIILLIVTSKNEIGSADIASLVTMALLPFFIYLIIKLSNKGKRKNNTYSTPQKPIPPPQNYQYRPQNQSFTNIQTQNNLRILQETCNIMETTNNLETFFSRFEVGKRIVSDLNNRNYLSDFYKKANLLKIEVLQKSFKNEEKNISSLKTAKAQQKHWESYLALLKKYEEHYTTDFHNEYENIVQAVQAEINLANNGNDISKLAKEALTSSIKVTSSTVSSIQSNNYKSDYEKRIINDYQNVLETENLYKTGNRNIFTDNQLSEEEQIFFKCVYDNFQNASLKPNLIKIERLSSGIFNVDYITEGYIGKVQISETKESFRVIKQGAKRASKVFNTLNDAKQYINERTNYYIEHNESKHIYFMQYFIGQKLHDDYFSSLQELIDTIPRWIKYVKYMKRN